MHAHLARLELVGPVADPAYARGIRDRIREHGLGKAVVLRGRTAVVSVEARCAGCPVEAMVCSIARDGEFASWNAATLRLAAPLGQRFLGDVVDHAAHAALAIQHR